MTEYLDQSKVIKEIYSASNCETNDVISDVINIKYRYAT